MPHGVVNKYAWAWRVFRRTAVEVSTIASKNRAGQQLHWRQVHATARMVSVPERRLGPAYLNGELAELCDVAAALGGFGGATLEQVIKALKDIERRAKYAHEYAAQESRDRRRRDTETQRDAGGHNEIQRYSHWVTGTQRQGDTAKQRHKTQGHRDTESRDAETHRH